MGEHRVVEDAILEMHGQGSKADFAEAEYQRGYENGLADGKAGKVAWLPHVFNDSDFKSAMEACDKILTVKGADYTQKQPDRLANFKEAALFLGQNKFQVLGVYLYKHLTAVFSFLKHGQVESEPIEGRIFDCINYFLLLYKMVQEQKRKGEEVLV